MVDTQPVWLTRHYFTNYTHLHKINNIAKVNKKTAR